MPTTKGPRRRKPQKLHKCACGGTRAESMIACRPCWRHVPRQMRLAFTCIPRGQYEPRLHQARVIVRWLLANPRPLDEFEQAARGPKPAPPPEPPDWFEEALDRARIIDAANASAPPCCQCGRAGTTAMGAGPGTAAGEMRHCEGCGHVFNIVEAVREIRKAGATT